MSAILSFILGLLGKALGSLFGKKDPTAVDLATSNARAQEQLKQEQAGNAILDKALRARSDADIGLRGDNGPSDSVNTDPDAPVNRSPDAHFRD